MYQNMLLIHYRQFVVKSLLEFLYYLFEAFKSPLRVYYAINIHLYNLKLNIYATKNIFRLVRTTEAFRFTITFVELYES